MTQTADPNPPTVPYAEGFSHEPLRLRVATVIREAILSGSLLPGAPLIEKTIAEDLEISRAPVREAIRTLAKEGLVESVPYKGSRVRVLHTRDVHEVYSIRGLLERYAVRQVLAADPAVDLTPLETACAAMEAAAAAGDARALTAADERFHGTLIALPDHELLVGMWSLIELRAGMSWGSGMSILATWAWSRANDRDRRGAAAPATLTALLSLSPSTWSPAPSDPRGPGTHIHRPARFGPRSPGWRAGGRYRRTADRTGAGQASGRLRRGDRPRRAPAFEKRSRRPDVAVSPAVVEPYAPALGHAGQDREAHRAGPRQAPSRRRREARPRSTLASRALRCAWPKRL